MKKLMFILSLSVMMLQSCITPCREYIQQELTNNSVSSVEEVEVREDCVETPSRRVEKNYESNEGILNVNIDRDFIKETPLTYQSRHANGHDYMIFVSVYGVAVVHDPDCSCGYTK